MMICTTECTDTDIQMSIFFYNFTLTCRKTEANLQQVTNDNMLVNVGGIPVGEVSYPQVTIVGDELPDHSVFIC